MTECESPQHVRRCLPSSPLGCSNIRFLNSHYEGNHINSEQAAMQLVSQVKFTGTPENFHRLVGALMQIYY